MELLLKEQAWRFCDAVARRRANIIAADQFYRDVLVYQWRLDAISSQLHAADMVRDAAVPSSSEEAALRRLAFDGCLLELAEQRAAAVAALAERASCYALCAPASATGRVERLAATAEERQAAVEALQRLANNTFDELCSEAREILRVEPGEAALQRLRHGLERRQEFWHGQMEDTWTAWQQATERMHQEGEKVLTAWSEFSFTTEQVVACWLLDPQGLQLPLLQAIASVTASMLEAELLQPVGLCGLTKLAQPGYSAEQAAEFSPDARYALLTSTVEVLRNLHAMHFLGDALLNGIAAAGSASHNKGSPLLPDLAKAAASLGSPSASGMNDYLAAWLLEGIVEALCSAAAAGDVARAQALLDLSRVLGGVGLAALAHSRPSKARAHRGRSALQVSAAPGRERVERLLRSWPEVEDLDSDQSTRCLDALATTPTPALKVPEAQVQFLKRMKVRAVLINACERLGASPVPVPFS